MGSNGSSPIHLDDVPIVQHITSQRNMLACSITTFLLPSVYAGKNWHESVCLLGF